MFTELSILMLSAVSQGVVIIPSTWPKAIRVRILDCVSSFPSLIESRAEKPCFLAAFSMAVIISGMKGFLRSGTTMPMHSVFPLASPLALLFGK